MLPAGTLLAHKRSINILGRVLSHGRVSCDYTYLPLLTRLCRGQRSAIRAKLEDEFDCAVDLLSQPVPLGGPLGLAHNARQRSASAGRVAHAYLRGSRRLHRPSLISLALACKTFYAASKPFIFRDLAIILYHPRAIQEQVHQALSVLSRSGSLRHVRNFTVRGDLRLSLMYGRGPEDFDEVLALPPPPPQWWIAEQRCGCKNLERAHSIFAQDEDDLNPGSGKVAADDDPL